MCRRNIKTIFSCSYSSAYTNDVPGNAIYHNNANFIFTDSSTFLCGVERKKCSDSSISVINSFFTISSYNSSSNYGIEGGSCASLNSAGTNSIVKFVNSVDSQDSFSLESRSNKYVVSMSNFLNFTYGSAVLWVDTNDVLELHDCCIFFGSSTIALTQCSAGEITCSIILSHCISDKIVDSITETTSLTTIPIFINFNCNVQNMKTCQYISTIKMSMIIKINLIYLFVF